MVIDALDLKNSRQAVMSEVFNFLGLRPLPDERFEYLANTTATRRVPASVNRALPVRAARKLVPALTDRVLESQVIADMFRPRRTLQDMTDTQRGRLIDRFRPDADKLRRLLGREFAHWSV
ncbi:MAG: hypothetical protein AAF583_01030 [Pseudomonadota bacterium]